MQIYNTKKDHGLISFYNAQVHQESDWLSAGKKKGQKFKIMDAKHWQKVILIRVWLKAISTLEFHIME